MANRPSTRPPKIDGRNPNGLLPGRNPARTPAPPPPTVHRPRLPGPSGLRCSLETPMNHRCLDPHTVAKVGCRSGFRFQRVWILAIRLEPVGRLVRHLRHVFRSGAAVSYCGRPVGS